MNRIHKEYPGLFKTQKKGNVKFILFVARETTGTKTILELREEGGDGLPSLQQLRFRIRVLSRDRVLLVFLRAHSEKVLELRDEG